MTPRPAVAHSGAAHGVSTESGFRAAWWCRNPHFQTLWPYLFRRHPRPDFRRERVELPDGDFVDLDWLGPQRAGLLAVVLHGLEGSSSSHYVRALIQALADLDMAVAVMHQRGCSGEPNRKPRFYHAGETGDFRFILQHLRESLPAARLYAVGYSLGGNILLKWLGEARDPILDAAVAVSVPFRLDYGAKRLERGASRIYQSFLLRSMKHSVALKRRRMAHPVDPGALGKCRTFEQIDSCLTAPLHGFTDAGDYYAQCSCRRFLGTVRTPTLIIHARDDPFMTPSAIPAAEELSPAGRLEVSRFGGHCGFVEGSIPLRPRYWLDRRIPEFILSRGDSDPGPGRATATASVQDAG